VSEIKLAGTMGRFRSRQLRALLLIKPGEFLAARR